MPTVTTIGGWAAILAVAGTYYWVNKQRKNKNLRSVNPKQLAKGTEVRRDSKAKKPKKDGTLSSDQDVKQPQKKKTQQPAKAVQEKQAVNNSADVTAEGDDKNDDKEFARQLSNAKRGVIDAPKSQASSRPKSVKQTRAQEKPVGTTSDDGTAPSSTAGADADDDQSPVTSPELPATKVGASAGNGDVSDMLEKPSGGPSVLRVTAPTNPTQPKKAKAHEFETKESKKQKQNRKKAEEAKLAREEDEKARKVQLEAHRRSVREAEGRAAKDGSAFMASQAPSKSVWTEATASKTATNGNGAAPKQVELLDTYEPTNGHVTVKPEAEVLSASRATGSKLEQELALIPEDEQLRLAKEDSSNWEQVKVKQSRKKKASKESEPETSSLKQDKASSNDEATDFSNPPFIAPTGPGKKWDVSTVHVERSGNHVKRELEVEDSEWEVA